MVVTRRSSTGEQKLFVRTSNMRGLNNDSTYSSVVSSPKISSGDLDSLRERMEQHTIPSYIRQSKQRKLSRTAQTTRFHIVEMDVFSTGDSYSTLSNVAPNPNAVSYSDLEETGIYRSFKVPENYSLSHLGALTCFLLGWPRNTAYQISIRDRGKRRSGVSNVEVWYHLLSEDPEMQDGRGRCDVKLVEVWNPYGLLSNRLRHLAEGSQQLASSLSVRVRCMAESVHNPFFPIDEPFGIGGWGAPPAHHLPKLRGSSKRLQERCETKRFDGWAFTQTFWGYVYGEVISEVDVEGVHIWQVDSDAFKKRLQVLERRASGDWLTDIEEFAVEFDD
ncbi:hypothetical protein FRC17_007511 [Serendipita sp. 399]|nr:hypothetical protein FRC17_007511 [Serendipita sp. 399]